MLRVGLTGGIGSGKTTVAKIFSSLGIPVYLTDDMAKQLMESDPELISAIKEKFGPQTYLGATLNRSFLAQIVFSDSEALASLNSLVHPAVTRHFMKWSAVQNSPYVILESAIVFDAGLDEYLDYTITVSAPEKTRIKRAAERDRVSEEKIYERSSKQLSDEQRNLRADHVIDNSGSQPILPQVVALHDFLLKKSDRNE